MSPIAKLLGLAAVTAVVATTAPLAGRAAMASEVDHLNTPTSEILGFFKEPWDLPSVNPGLTQIKQSDSVSTPLFQVEGVLGEGSKTVEIESGTHRAEGYRFQGEPGQALVITVTSNTFTPVIIWTDPETNTTISTTVGESGAASLTLVPPNSGFYNVIVLSVESPGEGGYQLRISSADDRETKRVQAERLLDQGLEQFDENQFQESLTSFEQSLMLYREIGDRDGEGRTLGNLGHLYIALEDYQRSIDFSGQALVIFRQVASRSDEAIVLGNLGAAYTNMNQFEQAITFFQQALSIARELQDRELESQILGYLGILYANSNQYQQAVDIYTQVLSIVRDLQDREKESLILKRLGAWSMNLMQYQQCINFYEQVLSIAYDGNNLEDQQNALSNIAVSYFNQGKYQASLDILQKELVVVQQINNKNYEVDILSNMASNYSGLGNHLEAINYSNQALEIARFINYRSGESRSLHGLGDSHQSLGQYQQALDFYQKALVISQEINDPRGEGRDLTALGSLFEDLSQYQQSLAFNQQALAIARELNDRWLEGRILGNLGITYKNLGRYQQAIDIFLERLSIAQEIYDRQGEANALGHLCSIVNPIGQYQQAVDLCQRTILITQAIGDRYGEGAALGNLGSIYHDVGQYDQAINVYQHRLSLAREIGDLDGQSAVLHNLGMVYEYLGQYQEALDFYQQSLAIEQEIGDQNGEATSLASIGLVSLKNQQPIIAEEFLSRALDLWDSLRTIDLGDEDKVALFDTYRAIFGLLSQAMIAQDKIESALEVAERGRARALVDFLTQQLDQDEAKLPDQASIQAFAQQQQTTLVEYSIVYIEGFEPILYAWVVSPDGTITFRQQPLTDIDLTTLVTDTRQAIGVRGVDRAGARPILNPAIQADLIAQQRAETDAKLTQLHELLIAPIADLLPTDPNQPVVFIPQDELFLVPFPALKDANGDYLIQHHTILTAPSIQVLQLTRDLTNGAHGNAPPRSGASRDLIVGDPMMPTVTFLSDSGNFEAIRLNPLSGARQEATAVAGFLNTTALLGDDASEARIKQQMAGANLIHLATHGLLEYGDPRETGSRDTPGAIALAPGQGEDGLLTSGEILQMNLQADLVVLSACDTGRGRLTGDGVIGLSRAFVAAGVPSIIVSLWSVPDAPTADLMTKFYRQLRQGQSKAQALRQAMLITMQQHPDPKNWAAFTLIGEGE